MFRAFVLGLLISFTLHAQDRCYEVVARPSLPTHVSAEKLFNERGYLGAHYDLIFSRNSRGAVDYSRAGQLLRIAFEEVPEDRRENLKREILGHMRATREDYTSETRAQFDMLSLALESRGPENWIQKTLMMDRRIIEILAVSRFISSYSPETAESMVTLGLSRYAWASKFSSPLFVGSDPTNTLPPKRALLLFLKSTLQWDQKLIRLSESGALKASDYLAHLKEVQDRVADTNRLVNYVPPKSVLFVLKALQKELKVRLKALGLSKAEAADHFLVLDGSFPNGLAFTSSSDVDLVIPNSLLRESFAKDEHAISGLTHAAMERAGYKGPRLPIQTVMLESLKSFNAVEGATEFGYLGAVSFRIFPDRIEAVIFGTDHADNLKKAYRIRQFNFTL
ncbi:MAG: hypothetical protein ACK5Y2_03325 [Bdellovibrionales bacterium]